MCTSVYSSLLLFLLTTTLTISIMCGAKMATEGLPLGRQERGADPDIIAGAEFLSVLIESSLRRAYSETTTAPSTTRLDLYKQRLEEAISSNYIRTPRETSSFAQTEGHSDKLYETTLVSDKKLDISDYNSVKDGVVVAVRVSSSVGRTINKELRQPFRDEITGTSTLSVSLTESPTTELLDQDFFASEEHPSIVAKSSKSELSVEESDPITKDTDLVSSEFSQGYPASIGVLPSQSQSSFDPTVSFLSHDLDSDAKPLHQTIIYHDNSREPGRARSVSYSTVIQHPHLQPEMEKYSQQQHERHERNYNGVRSSLINNFEPREEKRKMNDSKLEAAQDSMSEMNMYGTGIPYTSSPKTWENMGDINEPPKLTLITTERNWETQEKPYSPPPPALQELPKVYGQPEQNYEVDEAVSVDSNGRAHGLQPSVRPGLGKMEKEEPPNKKDDDNQKVGYVVEGRNYRKYRVEERTADGFIVGEYGVVSHDDGSLRGVRYTADGTINPRLIYDALMKFLSL